ncbi:MAG: hypothetical protein AAB558_03935 [Patescibacteria group bacterium]
MKQTWRKTKTTILCVGFGLMAWSVVTDSALAFTYQKNFILTDHEFRDSDSLSLKGIQNFLIEKGGVLKDYITTDVSGETASAAEIIYDTAQAYDLNPKVLLVMAEKESSAITGTSLNSYITDWTLGYAVCDGCSKDDPNVAKYAGLAKQFDAAGDRIANSYLADLEDHGSTISGWGPGIPKTTIDGIEVTPVNNATAALYTYNPCVGAYGGGDSRYGCNSLFAKLYYSWFASIKYPNGSLLQDGATGAIYLIRDGKKFLFENKATLLSSYSMDQVIQVSTVVLEQYEKGGNISFPNHSLVAIPDGTIYLVVDGTVRPFSSKRVFKYFGYNPEEVIQVKAKDITGWPVGKPLTLKDSNPTGVLLQNMDSGAISYVDSQGVRHDIWDKQILLARFGNQSAIPATTEEITEYTAGTPLIFPDGTLVTAKGNSSVYVIANGKKRAFKSKTDFDSLGYKWELIRTTTSAVLMLHPTGTPISAQ